MISTRHFINGLEFRPVNAENIGFKFDYSGVNWREAELTVDNIVFANEARDIVMQHVNTIGVFEGIPYQVQIGSVILDYYVDLTEETVYSDSTIEAKIKRRKAADWFKPLADGLSFEAINAANPITGSFNVPYVIVKDNQPEMLIMLGITTYILVKELITATKELIEAAAELIRAVTPDAPFASVKLGDLIEISLKVAARLVYVALLIVTLINLINQIIQIIIPSVRYLKGNTLRSLITQGLQNSNIQLGFSSTLTKLDATVLPVPLLKTNSSWFNSLFTSFTQSFNKGYPTASDTIPTLGSAIDEACNLLNAEWRIINNVLHIEEVGTFDNPGTSIVTTLNVQENKENQWSYNVGDSWKRYYLRYAYDATDTHTLDNINGTAAEYQTDPVTVVNADLVSIKGYVSKPINFALGSRKSQLNYVESQLLVLAGIADGLVNALGGSSSLSSQVLNRIGVLQISSQFFTTTKLLWTIGGKQPSNYLSIIGAKLIYEQHHTSNQVKENFQKVESSRVRFAPNQFFQLLNNNKFLDENGDEHELLTFEWINESREAQVTFTTPDNKGDNTKTTWIN